MGHIGDPIKAIFISVFDSKGRQLAQSIGDGDIVVTSMKYKFDDDDDDVCYITLQMSEPKALEQLDIGRGTTLKLKWGYLNNVQSAMATVVVRDMTSKYGTNKIYTELQCTDFLTFLKIVRSQDLGKASIIDYIREQIYGKYNFVIRNRQKAIYIQKRREEPEYETNYLLKSVEDGPEYDGPIFFDPANQAMYENNLAPEGTQFQEFEVSTVAVTIGAWQTTPPDDPLRTYIETEMDIPAGNRTIYQTLNDIFQKCPSGPWFITGRGNTLLIHNRNVNANAYIKYTYKAEPAYLLDFTATTKYENFERQSISYSGMDPKNRKNHYIQDYWKELFNQRTVKEILQDKEITREEGTKEIKEYLALYRGGYASFHSTKTIGSFYNQGTGAQRFVEGVPVGGVRHIGDGFSKTTDEEKGAAFEIEPPGAKECMKCQPGVDKFQQQILVANWYTIPLLSKDEAANLADNRQRELAMEKEEGVLMVEGDPHLRDGITVQVSNVYKGHEGLYYIKKCEHTMTQSGYKTKLECFRVNADVKISTIISTTKEGYGADGLVGDEDKYYIREQILFGVNTLVRSQDAGQIFGTSKATGTATISSTTQQYSQASINDLFNGRFASEDKLIAEMYRITDGADLTIKELRLTPGDR